MEIIMRIIMIVILTICIGITYACYEHYKYCEKIQYLENNGYKKHKLLIGYNNKYILCFTKGTVQIHEHELLNLTIKQLKEKYK